VLVSNAVDEAYAQAQLLLVTAVCCFVTQHCEVFGFGDIFHYPPYPVDDNVATQPYELVLGGFRYVGSILAGSGQVLLENSIPSINTKRQQ